MFIEKDNRVCETKEKQEDSTSTKAKTTPLLDLSFCLLKHH